MSRNSHRLNCVTCMAPFNSGLSSVMIHGVERHRCRYPPRTFIRFCNFLNRSTSSHPMQRTSTKTLPSDKILLSKTKKAAQKSPGSTISVLGIYTSSTSPLCGSRFDHAPPSRVASSFPIRYSVIAEVLDDPNHLD